ncbi:DEAD/DEAH box helicase [Halodesulfurarchaeum sp. HSR-GB]|uniref:DEAD/DEAH box helicase n=1 Tax=Halodesulfurarchaeum sp. HSR-GB TaxID=3074077 RepID=UPI0028674819|nr:DEAD/DEAH box helicase [Halodesulfurarchaeum sp. HSR-GB]MDR5657676.1 DEAD/DEAH box helicase [Halodesulfurarchaeum sp. HSR-GB]
MSQLDRWIDDPQAIPGSPRKITSKQGREPDFSPLELSNPIQETLKNNGITQPYSHQTKGVQSIRNGKNVVVATPTASGKSLVYTLTAFERALQSNSRALYIGPQVALINDQTKTLKNFASEISSRAEEGVQVESYSGQTDTEERHRIREEKPDIITTTPDMVHYSFLPYASDKWRWLFHSLDTVIIDEIHEYRGVFGGHVSQILRRLNRIAEDYDSHPQYITTSATIGNPIKHASRVTGLPADSFDLIENDASKSGPQEWVFWEPDEEYTPSDEEDDETYATSSHTISKEVLKQLIKNDYQTVVFTRARQAAERYATQTKEDFFENDDHHLADSVTAYHGALGAKKRTEIESGLKSGELKGVWSTNALELGVDIGSLDAVILDGYPGTTMAAHQQAGRAGRGDDTSLVLYVPNRDQLDHYMLDNPMEVLDGEPESATVDPFNSQIYHPHLVAAASENPVTTDESNRYKDLQEVANYLVNKNRLKPLKFNPGWAADVNNPQYGMSIRSIDSKQIDLIDKSSMPSSPSGDNLPTPDPTDEISEDESRNAIGSLQYRSALRDAHPGAIYYHQGQKYEVQTLDIDDEFAALEKTDADHYTQPLFKKEVSTNEIEKTESLTGDDRIIVGLADVTVTEHLLGYRVTYSDGSEQQEYRLKLPPSKLNTRSIFLAIRDGNITEPIEEKGYRHGVDSPLRSALHAIEHTMIGLLPLEILVDRNDVGGLSSAAHSETGLPTIFIYDAHPGGVGIAPSAFNRVRKLLENTHNRISACDCDDGCPKCIIDSNCGNANDFLNKHLAVDLLDSITELL